MKIAIIGIGYVGLPLAVHFSKKFFVTAVDDSVKRISNLKKGLDQNLEYKKKDLINKKLYFTRDLKKIEDHDYVIITLPTPVNEKNFPDLSIIKDVSKKVGKFIKKGSIIIYESTFYPGCVEEICIPILEKNSKKKCNKDFGVGYSPERINPSDKVHTLTKIKKLVSGSSPIIAKKIQKLYDKIIKPKTLLVSSIKVAEAAKVVENTQRDVNIAMVNELSYMFNRMKINTKEVIKAASTKWNFHSYNPGLVGGHCIGVDPYYLIYKSKKFNYKPNLLIESRSINEKVVSFILENIKNLSNKNSVKLKKAKVGILGFAFKENCPDARNTKVYNLFKSLTKNVNQIVINDPYVDREYIKNYYDIEIDKDFKKFFNLDILIMAVSHQDYLKLRLKKIKSFFKDKKKMIFIDIKGNFSEHSLKKNDFKYFQL